MGCCNSKDKVVAPIPVDPEVVKLLKVLPDHEDICQKLFQAGVGVDQLVSRTNDMPFWEHLQNDCKIHNVRRVRNLAFQQSVLLRPETVPKAAVFNRTLSSGETGLPQVKINRDDVDCDAQRTTDVKELVGLMSRRNGNDEIVATRKLGVQAFDDGNRRAITRAGGLEPVIALLADGGKHDETTEAGRRRAQESREVAAMALHNLCGTNINRHDAGEGGAIPPVSALLSQSNPSDQGRTLAAGLVHQLSKDTPENASVFANDPQVLADLAHLLNHGSNGAKENAAMALQSMVTSHRDNARTIGQSAGTLDALVSILATGSQLGKERACNLVNLLALHEDNKLPLLEAGAVPAAVEFFRSGTPIQQTAAANLLQNLATTPETQRAIADAGAIPELVRVLDTGSGAAKEKAAGALCNLSSSNPSNQDAIVAAGAIAPLVHAIRRGNDACKENAAATLQNLTAHSPANRDAAAAAGAAEALLHCLDEDIQATEAAKARAAWCLLNCLLDNNRANADAVRNLRGAGTVSRALRALGPAPHDGDAADLHQGLTELTKRL